MRDRRPPKNSDSLTRPVHHTPRRIVNKRAAVLVVLHHDGYVEVYGDQIDAHICVMPYMPTSEGEILADKYLTTSLPHRYRAIYWPGMIRATGLVETVRPSDIARRSLSVQLLAAIGTLSADDAEVIKWTC